MFRIKQSKNVSVVHLHTSLDLLFCQKFIQKSGDNRNRRNLSLTEEFCEINKRRTREFEKVFSNYKIDHYTIMAVVKNRARVDVCCSPVFYPREDLFWAITSLERKHLDSEPLWTPFPVHPTDNSWKLCDFELDKTELSDVLQIKKRSYLWRLFFFFFLLKPLIPSTVKSLLGSIGVAERH